eukprot:3982456-Amphidinium_carterae.1
MVQKSLSLNSNKAAKGGRRHDKPQAATALAVRKVSKVDLLKKKKKDDVRKLVPGAKTAERKKTVRCVPRSIPLSQPQRSGVGEP